ncbi:hypothetical protein [Neisseria dentiae]|uniref:hypothetical protein n=1 Tax=Neisseria dentiae TaxID=194197 RepID=UPI000A196D40|nr:hypothetical protein [Neisseria dentiae]QMT45410.1 hypothetical protein H3L92_00740 [Neisseria dentiae]STZ51190.1 Uncharacterised protein [Neisseria dentiae]
MDATDFGRVFGVMVSMNSLNNQVIYTQYVRQESTVLYELRLKTVMNQGIHIQIITTGGFKELTKLFPGVPFQ